MAKMIKCPTCATPIEAPPHADGQIVKCPNCGKALKLVARKPHAGAPSASGGTGPGGSVAGGSVSGSSISALTVNGQAQSPRDRGAGSSPDDLPNLDSICAVCGRSTEPEDLVEDNGKLVCPDCIKGARSSIDRPEGGAELVAFKPAAYVPTRRTRLIHFTPSLVAIVLIGLVYVGCSVYLNLFPKPVGTADASLTKKHQVVVPPITSAIIPAPPTVTPAPSQPVEQSNPTPAPIPAPQQPNSATQPATPIVEKAPTTQHTLVAQGNNPPKTGSILFGDSNASNPATPAVNAAPVNDPLEQGMEALMDKKYDDAYRSMALAKAKYVRFPIHATLSGQAIQALEGYGAACIGDRKPDEAKAILGLAREHTPADQRSRALVVNRVVAMLQAPAPPVEFGFAVEDLQRYLQSNPDDDYAADVFGMALEKAKSISTVKKESLAAMWQFLNQYNDRLAQDPQNQQAHPNQLKWGVEWLPAEDVKSYRAARGQGDEISLTQAARDLESARAKNKIAQDSLNNAKQMQAAGRPVAMQGYQNNADAAAANLAAAQKAFDIARAGLHPAKWLSADQLQPVLPETRAPSDLTPR